MISVLGYRFNRLSKFSLRLVCRFIWAWIEDFFTNESISFHVKEYLQTGILVDKIDLIIVVVIVVEQIWGLFTQI